MNRSLRILLWLLLFALILRLWIQPLRSSFWVDEMATVFLVDHPADPSLSVVPQLRYSLYYPLASEAERLFGNSEIAMRLPSLVCSLGLLSLLALLARRLICQGTEWLVIFVCFGLRLFNFLAIDARPYAMGMLVSAACVFFLVRWLDSARWLDAALFLMFAAALWRVHLIFWPFYLVLAIYAAARLWRKQTHVSTLQLAMVFAALAALLIPVAREALLLAREARQHVIIKLPSLHALVLEIKLLLVLGCAGGAWLLARVFRWHAQRRTGDRSLVLIAAWWLCQPLALFAFSWLTGNSVFLSRYLCLALPGTALMAAFVVSRFVPVRCMAHVSACIGICVLLLPGDWRHPAQHSHSQWRAAAEAVNRSAGDDTAVLCPSPFIEARWPQWKPDYALPGFLFSHLAYYQVHGQIRTLPFLDSPEAQSYAQSLAQGFRDRKRAFLIYGGNGNVDYWQRWLLLQPALANWSSQTLGNFGDVQALRMAPPNVAPAKLPPSSR